MHVEPRRCSRGSPGGCLCAPVALGRRGRTATPLELLFDLTFVVAVALLASQLAQSIAKDHAAKGLLGYLMVFFAIWAWMNVTWFASATYGTDDVAYRLLLTMVQMRRVLVLAAGVPAAFERQRASAW